MDSMIQNKIHLYGLIAIDKLMSAVPEVGIKGRDQ